MKKKPNAKVEKGKGEKRLCRSNDSENEEFQSRERESATTEFPCSKNIHVVEPYTLLLLLDVPRFRGEKTPLAFK